MHAIYAFQHTRKPPFFVDRQEAGNVFDGRFSQINFAKRRNNNSAKSVHGLNACGLAHPQVLVNRITRYSICKLAIEWLPNMFGTRKIQPYR
jgi:hypothetical protein